MSKYMMKVQSAGMWDYKSFWTWHYIIIVTHLTIFFFFSRFRTKQFTRIKKYNKNTFAVHCFKADPFISTTTIFQLFSFATHKEKTISAYMLLESVWKCKFWKIICTNKPAVLHKNPFKPMSLISCMQIYKIMYVRTCVILLKVKCKRTHSSVWNMIDHSFIWHYLQ